MGSETRVSLASMRLKVTFLLCLAAVLAFVASGCGGSSKKSSAPPSASCKVADLNLVKAGQLAVGTDNPAFPPWFGGTPPKGSTWKVSDPNSSQGFESAVAYAVADKLGFPKSEVKWTVVPFNSSYAPGPKKFDFDINQISVTPARKKVVDFSDPYYVAPQGVVTGKGSTLKVSKISDLKDAEIGVQIGTTSLDAVKNVIMPSKDPKVFNDSNDVVTALKQNQVDAIVTDLPTAFYITAAQVPGSTIVGQFNTGEGDSFGLLLEKDSHLTPCLDKAIGELTASGELKKITDKWMGKAAGAPELELR